MKIYVYSIVGSIILLVSCKNVGMVSDIFVSVPPQKYFVEKIVADTKTVTSVVSNNGNPEIFEITLQNLKKLEAADLFFTIGVPYEYNLVKVIHKKKDVHVQIKNMAYLAQYRNFSVNKKYDEINHVETDVKNEHKQIDPHIWLSLKNATKLAEYTYEVLVKQYPTLEMVFTQNYNILLQELFEFNLVISSKLKTYRSHMFLIYHSALGYIADEYGLVQIPIQWKQKERSVVQIKNIVRIGIKNNIKTIFIQDGFSTGAAKSIADKLGGSVYVIDPMHADWKKNILDITTALVQSFN